MAHLNSSFQPDLEPFVDFDQDTFTPSTLSPGHKGKGAMSHRPSFVDSASSFGTGQSEQTFAGPSFQYEEYKQQTGLPVGGLANTFAINQATGLQFTGSHQGFVMPIDTLNVPLSNLDEFDFGCGPSMDMADMDLDLESPSGSMASTSFPADDSARGQFVSSSVLVDPDDSPIVYNTPVQRMYPGMHSQQAARAKVLQAQKQQEMRSPHHQQQQQQEPQQQTRLQGQRALPTQSKVMAPKDPHVEESISRLLQQMRQNSLASAPDDVSTPTCNGSSMSRMKKDEEEMDEDERLLASEEGKKLSSKERRQLRNKVSARAFRSRRKGKDTCSFV